MYMIMLVLNNPSLIDKVLDAWSTTQITGATIIESTGLQRRHHRHLPMRYSYSGEEMEETGNVTLFAIVSNKTIIQECLRVTEEITGDLDLPDTGVFASWVLNSVKGVPQKKGD